MNKLYLSSDGKEIMNYSNFPFEIIKYLDTELLYISKLVSFYNYDTVIKLGCDKIRLHPISVINNIKYIGFDIRKELKDVISKYLKKNNYKGYFFSADILNHLKLIDKINSVNTCKNGGGK